MPTLLVMAAGLASRYDGLKQIEPVGPRGETLLDYSVFDARRAGFDRVVLVIRRDMDEPFAPIERQLARQIEVVTAYQDLEDVPSWFRTPEARCKPWGTVHAVLAARHSIPSSFTVLNADDFYGVQAFRLAAGFLGNAVPPGCGAVVALPVERTLSDSGPVTRALCHVAGNWLVGIEELRGLERTAAGITAVGPAGPRRLTGRELVSVNFWAFPPEMFERLSASFEAFLRAHGTDPAAELVLPEAVGTLVHDGGLRVRVLEAPGPWLGITHREDLPSVRAAVRELVRRGEYPDPLWGG